MRAFGPVCPSLPFSGLGFLFLICSFIFSSHSSPINRQAGIGENVYITVQNDTYGNEQRVCSIESMTYEDGESIPTSSPCEHCICRPPGFACTIISCEYRPGCKAMKRSNHCCPEYQCECEKDGKIYQNGEKILDENNPCEVCYCQGGDVVCAVIDCYWRNDCQPRYIENRCCPLYDHCPPPSDIGPIRPTQRPLITSPTVAPSILWFNLSSAVYSTKVTTIKPERFQTSTQLVPVPDEPKDHFLEPPHEPPSQEVQQNIVQSLDVDLDAVPQKDHQDVIQPQQQSVISANEVVTQSHSEENKFPQSIESEIIQSQHPEVASSSESIESGDHHPPQILEFPPSLHSETVQHIESLPAQENPVNPPQPEIPEPAPSTAVPEHEHVLTDIESNVPAAVQPEFVHQPQAVSINSESEKPAAVLVQPIQPETETAEDKNSETSSHETPYVPIPSFMPEETETDPLKSETAAETVEALKPEVIAQEVQTAIIPSAPAPGVEVVEPLKSQVPTEVISFAPTPEVEVVEPLKSEVPTEVTIISESVHTQTQEHTDSHDSADNAPVESEIPHDEEVVTTATPETPDDHTEHVDQEDHGQQKPLEPVDSDLSDQVPVVVDEHSQEVVNEATTPLPTPQSDIVQEVYDEIVSSQVVPEIAPTNVILVEDSSNILEIPPAVLESSEPPLSASSGVPHTSTEGLNPSEGITLSSNGAFVTALSTETVSREIAPSTVIIHSAPSLVVIGTVPVEQSEQESPADLADDLLDSGAAPTTVPTGEELVTGSPTQQPEPEYEHIEPSEVPVEVVTSEAPDSASGTVTVKTYTEEHKLSDDEQQAVADLENVEYTTVGVTLADDPIVSVELHVSPQVDSEKHEEPLLVQNLIVSHEQLNDESYPPTHIISDQSQELSGTPPPVIVSSEVIVQPEIPDENAAALNDHSVQPTHQPIEATVSPVLPEAPEIQHDEPVVFVEVDSIFPGIQSDDHTNIEENSNANELSGVHDENSNTGPIVSDVEPVVQVQLTDEQKQSPVVPLSEEIQNKPEPEQSNILFIEPVPTNVEIDKVSNLNANAPDIVIPDVIVAKPEYVVLSDVTEVRVPNIILEPPQYDFKENQIEEAAQVGDTDSKFSIVLQPPKDDELDFQPVILSHVKTVELNPTEPSVVEIVPTVVPTQAQVDLEILSNPVDTDEEIKTENVVLVSEDAKTESSVVIIEKSQNVEPQSSLPVSDDAEFKPTEPPNVTAEHPAILLDDIQDDAAVEQTTIGVLASLEDLQVTDSPVVDNITQLPVNPMQSVTDVEVDVPTPSSVPFDVKSDTTKQEVVTPVDPVIFSDDASPVFDERPAEIQSTDQTTVQPLIDIKQVNHADVVPEPSALSDGMEEILGTTESPNLVVNDEISHDDVPEVSTTEEPIPEVVSKGRIDLEITVQSEDTASDEKETESSVSTTTESKYRLDMSIFEPEDLKDEKVFPTTTFTPVGLPSAEPLFQVLKGKSESSVPATTLQPADSELVFDDVNNVPDNTETIVNDDAGKEQTTSNVGGKGRYETEADEEAHGSTLSTSYFKERKEVDSTETPVPEIVHDEADIAHTTAEFDLSQNHHLSDDAEENNDNDISTTEESAVYADNHHHAKFTKKEHTEKLVKKENATQIEKESSEEGTSTYPPSFEDDTVIIDRQESSPQFRMPSELVHKIDPISDDIETVPGAERSDLTVQQEAENEVADAEETWFWRTFNRVRTMPLFLPAAPSARRPRRSAPEETEYFIRGKKVPLYKSKKILKTEDSKKEWAFPRFLFW